MAHLATSTIFLRRESQVAFTALETSMIELYETRDYHFTPCGDTVIAEYAWVMKWSSEGTDHLDRGREILALNVSNHTIKIFWRTQIATP
jgi:hypothetical protein